MKSCWVSTSQKMTRGMARNLFEDMGTCQQLDAQTQQTRRRTEVNSASEQVFRWLTSVFLGASSYCLVYSLSTTATSSQQFCLGHRAQSAHTLSGNCSRSAGTKPSFKKNAGLRVRASTSCSPCARASAVS